MTDHQTAGLTALDRTTVPVTWGDVEARLDGGDLLPLLASPDGRPPTGHRRLLVAAALVAVAGVGSALAGPRADRDEDVRTIPVTTAAADPIATTLPPGAVALPPGASEVGTVVRAWTGTQQLVWTDGELTVPPEDPQPGEGDRPEAGDDAWSYDPATGSVADLPAAPFRLQADATATWTGTEVVVTSAGTERSAAAFDPATGSWRILAETPAEIAGPVLGSAWVAGRVVVVAATMDATHPYGSVAVTSYDPSTDTWTVGRGTTATNPLGTVVAAGDEVVLWTRGSDGPDRGQRYDPIADAWTALPEFPSAHPLLQVSPVWVDGELLVWGTDGSGRPAAGFRWRPGDQAWRNLAAAPTRPIDGLEGRLGSQRFVVDRASGQVLLVTLGGGEARDPDRGGDEAWSVLAYDPVTDGWSEPFPEARGVVRLVDPLVVDGRFLSLDREHPVDVDVDP